jgi:hypothetical protein
MSRTFTKLSGIFILLVFVISCETDFYTTAEYEDITVVYGLLDQQQGEQYIKINKAFLSETDVLTYAQNADSSNYPFQLEVSLQEINENGNVVNTYTFDTTTIYNKEPGVFYSPEQILYKWNAPEWPISYDIVYWGQNPVDTIPVWLNTDNTYKLVIKNPETGKEIKAETSLVDKFALTSPIPYTSTITFVPDPFQPRAFRWNNPDNGGRYEINMEFEYGELKVGSTDTVYKTINIMSNTVTTQPGENEAVVYFSDDRFYTACDILIPYDDPALESQIQARFSSFIIINITAAEENFALYLEVNEPSTSIVQDKPQFSNVENGIGIFSARSNYTSLKKLNSQSASYLIADYPHLKFVF